MNSEEKEIFGGNQMLVLLESPNGEEVSLSIEEDNTLEEGDLIWLDDNDPFPYMITYIFRNVQY